MSNTFVELETATQSSLMGKEGEEDYQKSPGARLIIQLRLSRNYRMTFSPGGAAMNNHGGVQGVLSPIVMSKEGDWGNSKG